MHNTLFIIKSTNISIQRVTWNILNHSNAIIEADLRISLQVIISGRFMKSGWVLLKLIKLTSLVILN